MKKICTIASLAFLWSCGNSAPKCDDKEVIETAISILNENSRSLIDEFGRNSILIDPKKAKIKNIMTKSSDGELKSCGCEGTIETNLTSSVSQVGSVSYSAQKNSEGEVIVNVDDAGPFRLDIKKLYK